MPSDESKGSQLDAIGSLAQRQLDNTCLGFIDTLTCLGFTCINQDLARLESIPSIVALRPVVNRPFLGNQPSCPNCKIFRNRRLRPVRPKRYAC